MAGGSNNAEPLRPMPFEQRTFAAERHMVCRSDRQKLFGQKLSSAQMMMMLGKDIAERSGAGESVDVEQIYDEWAQMRGELQA
jgi:hypothetical protein